MALHAGANQYNGTAFSAKVSIILVGDKTNAGNNASRPGQILLDAFDFSLFDPSHF